MCWCFLSFQKTFYKTNRQPGRTDCLLVWMWGVKEKDMGVYDKESENQALLSVLLILTMYSM